MRYLLDTYAWIEYFLSSEKGKIVKRIIDDEQNELLTLDPNLAEVWEWCHKNNKNFDHALNVITALSKVQSIFLHDWLSAAEKKAEMRNHHPSFGLIDSLILTKHQQFKGKLITGDQHFKNIDQVLFIGD